MCHFNCPTESKLPETLAKYPVFILIFICHYIIICLVYFGLRVILVQIRQKYEIENMSVL